MRQNHLVGKSPKMADGPTGSSNPILANRADDGGGTPGTTRDTGLPTLGNIDPSEPAYSTHRVWVRRYINICQGTPNLRVQGPDQYINKIYIKYT